MSIEFRCSQCEKRLRVPAESAGRRVKCPHCGEAIVVPLSGSAMTENEGFRDNVLAESESNPFTDGGFSKRTAADHTVREPFNPYSAPDSDYGTTVAETFVSGEVVPTAANAGEVIGYAWEVWKSNLGILVGITAITFGINIMFGVVQGATEEVIRQQGEHVMAASVGGVINLLSSMTQIFLGIGQAQIALKLLRRQTAEINDLFGGGPLFLRVLGASILGGLVVILGFVALIVPGFLLILFFWPFYYLIVDRKSRAIESFGMAFPIAKANVGTSIVLSLATIGIMLVGFLALCIGILFAAPLVSLIWGTAFLMMSGQLALGSQHSR